MIIKAYLKPLLKRFIGLFLSMAAVSMLAISLMIAFLVGLDNLALSIKDYRNAYGSADGVIDTSLVNRETVSGLTSLPEIQDADFRIVSYGNIQRNDGRVITCRVLSHDPNDDIYRLHFDEKDLKEGSPDVFLEATYAANNGYHLGDTIKIGYFGFFISCRVGAIVKTPESMYVRAEDYIWSDNYDFGYVYLEEHLFTNVLIAAKNYVEEKIAQDPDFYAFYQKALKTLGDSLPDFRDIADEFVSTRCNQILIKKADGYSEEHAINAARTYLEKNSVRVKASKKGAETPAVAYMERCVKQLNVAATFLPVFFFGVALLVIVLFINQIIKSMTPEIGTMVSIGISPGSITGLFSIFILLMSILSIFLGIGLGYGLLTFLLQTFVKIYALPSISYGLTWYIVLLAAVLTIAVGQGAVGICSMLIYRITPKDAMLNNESKRKPLPKWVQKGLDKMHTMARISINSILQNKRRFFVSVFSMFAAFTLIGLTSNFYVSKNELLSQTTTYRMKYDVQTYVTGSLPDDFPAKLANEESITLSEIVDYTYLPVIKDGITRHLQAMGVGNDRSEMVVIPNEKGKGNLTIPETGIILPTVYAETLDVKVGDYLSVNGRSLQIKSLSKQYANATCFLSKDVLESLEVTYATSILARVNDQNAYSSFLSKEGIMCLSVFSDRLAADFNRRLEATDVMVFILVGFGFLMGFVILAIMSQNALMEQKKAISIMRAIGFDLWRISHLWTWQSIFQLLFATIFALPATVLFTIVLFNMASSSVQTYPFFFSWPVYAIAFGFVLLIIILTILLSLRTISRWNLADNTRTRE